MTTPLEDDLLERLVRIFDTFTCGVLAESEGHIVFVNEKLARMVGTEREKLWGRPTRELIPEELRELLDEEIVLIEKGDHRARLTALRLEDGTTTPVLVLPMAQFSPQGHERLFRFDVILALGAVMTARHMLYEGEEKLRTTLSRIAIDLQAASLLAGNLPAANPDLHHPELEPLSKREREVLARLVEGQRVPTIAEQLFISQHTVRNHLKSMFRKLDVGSQAELLERVREMT